MLVMNWQKFKQEQMNSVQLDIYGYQIFKFSKN